SRSIRCRAPSLRRDRNTPTLSRVDAAVVGDVPGASSTRRRSRPVEAARHVLRASRPGHRTYRSATTFAYAAVHARRTDRVSRRHFTRDLAIAGGNCDSNAGPGATNLY